MAEKQYVAFRLDGQLYGVDILLVREIVGDVTCTPVADTPAAVYGLMNLRGQIVTVIDPRVAMGDPPAAADARQCLVLKTAAETRPLVEAGLLADTPCQDALGLLVDEIVDVVTSRGVDIDPPPSGSDAADMACVDGVLKLADRILPLLSVRALLARIKNDTTLVP